MSTRSVVAALSAAVVAASLAAAPAASPAAGTLDEAHARLFWRGATFSDSSVPGPEACAVFACDRFTLRVALPEGYWDTHPGGIEVAIRWAEEYDVFGLYVYDGRGALLASSSGFPSSAANVIIPRLANGAYQVVVVPEQVEESSYEGVAEIEPGPAAAGRLLPDLLALAPEDFHIELGTYSLSRERTRVASCYPVEETVEEGATRCLRFSQGIANLGAGPFLLKFKVNSVATDAEVRQVVRSTDGPAEERPAGTYELHPTHGHFHYKGFAHHTIYNVDERGVRTTVAAEGRKNDFCMIDTELVWFGVPGNGARSHFFPACNLPAFVDDDDGEAWMEQGIEAGWADVYTWDLPGQYVDISDLDDGVYDVVTVANPGGLIRSTEGTTRAGRASA